MTLTQLLQIIGIIPNNQLVPASTSVAPTPAGPALPPPEVVELALHIARFLPISSLLKLAQVNLFWRDIVAHPLLWNRFLVEKFRSNDSGIAKSRFLNQPGMRSPEAQLLGWSGQHYVFAGVRARTSDYPISRILRGGELTGQEQDLFANIDGIVQHGNIHLNGRINLDSPPVRAFIATNLLTVQDAMDLTANQRLNLESKSVQAYIAIQYLTFSQAKDLTENQRASLDSVEVRNFIYHGSLKFSRALMLTRDQRLNLESVRVQMYRKLGKISFEDMLNLTSEQRQNLESRLVEYWISKGEISFEQGKNLAPEQYITISKKHGRLMHFKRLMEGTGTDLASRIIQEGVPAALNQAYNQIINRIKRANPTEHIFWNFNGEALRPIAGFLLGGQLVPEKMTNESCNKLLFVFERSTAACAFFIMGLTTYDDLLKADASGVLNLNSHEFQTAILVDRTLTVKQAISCTGKECRNLIEKAKGNILTESYDPEMEGLEQRPQPPIPPSSTCSLM
jgi:hypothetical protein